MANFVEEILSGFQEGTLHSHGAFTLDFHSHHKLNSLLEQEPCSWCYWLLKAAVDLECEAISLQLSSTRLEMTLHQPSSQCLRNYLLAEVPVGQPNLTQGLSWLQAWLAQTGTLKALVQFQELGLAWDGEVMQRLLLQESHKHLQLSSGYPEGFPQRLEQDLRERASYSLLPLTLNGQRLDSGWEEGDCSYLRYYIDGGTSDQMRALAPLKLPAHHYLWGQDSRSRPRFCQPLAQVHTLELCGNLAEAHKPASGQAIARWNQQEGSRDIRLLGLPPHCDRLKIRALLHRTPDQLDRFALVNQGLRLNWEALQLAPRSDYGWSALVASDGCHTDLSGLRIRQDAFYDRVYGWLVSEIADLHRSMRGPSLPC